MILSFEGERKKFLALLQENKGVFILDNFFTLGHP